ncbi:MAG: restriction endonuclease subunit S [Methanomicrobiales archaeon]|nr:restriction endonuclease subunit S [Methanomicrobiales archaeon]
MTSSNWTQYTIKDFMDKGEVDLQTGPFGTQLHASDYVDTGTPMINARNIGFGEIRTEKLEYLSEDTVKRLSSHLLHTNDLVFGRKGTVERHVLILPEQDGWFQGTDCLRIRFKSKSINPRFVSYTFLTDYHKQWMINQSSHGATMTSLNQEIISRIPLNLPDIQLQNKIAAILSAYDDLIENNTRRIKIIEEMAQAIYREWFVDFRFPGHEGVRMVESELGLVPEGWEKKKISDVANLFRGRSYGSDNLVEAGGLPFLNLKCLVRDGGFRSSGIKRYQGPYKETQTATEGDIVIAVTDMTQERRIVAHAARIPRMEEPLSVLSMDLVKIVPKEGIYSEYLYGLIRYSPFADEIKQHANGVNVLHLNPDRIGEYEFHIAPKELRQSYSEKIGSYQEMCDILQLKNTNLRRTRDLLLPKLISGEIDVSGLDIQIPSTL